jgi:hypothetical protein
MTYTARYAHSDSDTPGKLNLDATTDDEAIKEVTKFVTDGFRNSTWCTVELSNGRHYTARNTSGHAFGTVKDLLP